MTGLGVFGSQIPRGVEPYLSRKLQAMWPSSLVTFAQDRHGVRSDFRVDRPGEKSLGLGATFKEARAAVVALRKAHRAAKVSPTRGA